jgi:hypothetical protein
MLGPVRLLLPVNPACAIYDFPSDSTGGPWYINHGNIPIRSSSARAHPLTLPSSKIRRPTSVHNFMAKSAARPHPSTTSDLTTPQGAHPWRRPTTAPRPQPHDLPMAWSLAERWQRTKDVSEMTIVGANNNIIPSQLAVGPRRCRATTVGSSPTLATVVTDALELGVG